MKRDGIFKVKYLVETLMNIPDTKAIYVFRDRSRLKELMSFVKGTSMFDKYDETSDIIYLKNNSELKMLFTNGESQLRGVSSEVIIIDEWENDDEEK